MDIVFIGSGPVAAASLRLLHQSFNIEAVITKPAPAHHRGSVPVIELCQELNLKTLTAANRQTLDELIDDNKFTSKVAVLIDFGIIISNKVINTFEKGIVNSHFSILPEWRGADPITFALLSGQPDTGVSLMLVVEKMDEGPLIGYQDLPITTKTNIQSLTNELINLSYELLKTELPKYYAGSITPKLQSITGREVSYSRKLTKEDGNIDWSKPAEQIEREIRAFLGWPGSRATIAGKEVQITKAQVIKSTGKKPGDASVIDKQLVVACGQDSLIIERLKPAGKNEMDAQAFLAGHKHLIN